MPAARQRLRKTTTKVVPRDDRRRAEALAGRAGRTGVDPDLAPAGATAAVRAKQTRLALQHIGARGAQGQRGAGLDAVCLRSPGAGQRPRGALQTRTARLKADTRVAGDDRVAVAITGEEARHRCARFIDDLPASGLGPAAIAGERALPFAHRADAVVQRRAFIARGTASIWRHGSRGYRPTRVHAREVGDAGLPARAAAIAHQVADLARRT